MNSSAPARTLSFSGLVLQNSPFGEAHSHISVLDPRHGRLEFVAFNINKENSRRAAAVVCGVICRGLLTRKDETVPFSLKEAELTRDFPGLQSGLQKSTHLLFLLEILSRVVPPELPFEEFSFLMAVLDRMDRLEHEERFLYHFLVRCFASEGILPLIENSADYEAWASGDPLAPKAPGNGTLRFIRDAGMNDDPDFFLHRTLSREVAAELRNFSADLVRRFSGVPLGTMAVFKE